jgi:hypothetical protein
MTTDNRKTPATIGKDEKTFDTAFVKTRIMASEPPPVPPRPVTIIHTGRDGQGQVHQDFMDNPVVGWLVVVQGAGQGISLPLGNGANTLGRSSHQRVMLDFGDTQISRDNHAVITYDPKGRRFYLQNGSGVNLTYLQTDAGSLPVLSPVVLESGQHIQLGNTTLKFVALCGSGFGWDDTSSGV